MNSITNEIRYALSRHLPAMADGFSISTVYGEVRITAEESRRHPAFRHELESLLRFRLFRAERVGGAA